MSDGTDALTDLLRRHDGAIAPPVDFADRLEARLLAELGPAAVVRSARRAEPVPVHVRSRGAAGPMPGRRGRWMDVAAAAVLLVGVMGGMLSQLTDRDTLGGLVPDPATIAAPDLLSTAAGEEAPVMEGGSPARANRFAGPRPVDSQLVERWAATDSPSNGQSVPGQVIPFGDTVYRVLGSGTTEGGEPRFVYGGFGVEAHRLDTGALIWSHPISAAVPIAVAEAGVVAVVPGDATPGAATPGVDAEVGSRLTLLDHATGTELWSYALPSVAGDNRRSPIIDGDTVYYADIDATVYALDFATGAERWVSSAAAAAPSADLEGCFPGSGLCGFGGFAIGDGSLYLFTSAGTLAALDLVDGSVRWQVDIVDRYALPVRPVAFLTAVPGGLVLNLVVGATPPAASTQEVRYVRLDATSGDGVWERRVTAQIGFTAVADGERLYVGQADEFGGCCAIVALDLGSGETIWTSTATRVVPVGMVSGELYAVLNSFGSANQLLMAVDPETGAERWRQSVPAGTPSLPLAHDGTMFVNGGGFPRDGSGLFAYRSVGTGSASVASEEPVVMEGGSPARDNVWAGPALSGGTLEPRWEATLWDSQSISGMTWFEDTVYAVIPLGDRTDAPLAGGPDVRIEARDITTGAVRWSVKAGSVFGSPVASKAGVLLLESELGGPTGTSQTATLRMLDLATGGERWRYEMRPTTTATLVGPIVADGTVYSVDAAGVAYALDAKTGAERWVSRTARAFPATETFDCGAAVAVCYWGGFAYRDGVLYLVNSAAEVYALDAATGTTAWKVDIGERYALERTSVTVMATEHGVVLNMTVAPEAPVDGGGRQPVGFRTVLLDRATGGEIWMRDDVADLTNATSDGERLFLHNVPLTAGCCAVIALDLATGETVWTIGEAYGYPLGLLGGTGGALVRVDARHEEQVFIVGIDPATGMELWRLETDQDYPLRPVAADGTLFTLESDGTLTAFTVIPDPVGATPAASPVASPVAGGPVATPVAGGPVATPVAGGPVATPVAGGPVEEPQAGAFEPDHVLSSGGDVNLRLAPTTAAGGATVIRPLPDGTPLRATGRTAPADSPGNGPWVEVELKDGTVGWVRAGDVSPVSG